MRALVRVLASALSIVSIAACTDRQDPVAPLARRIAPSSASASGTITASSGKLALLMFEVSGSDLTTPLRYDVVLSDGISKDPLPMPEGKSYQVSVRGYDYEGQLTHEGGTSVEYVAQGKELSLGMELKPESEGAEPVTLEVGVLGQPRLEKGSKIVIEAPAGEIKAGESVHFSAYVLDPRGERMKLDASAFQWFIDDPHVDLFAPARPHGPQDDLNINSIGELERLHVGVTVLDESVVVLIPISLAYDPIIDISAGHAITCSLRQSGRIDCWGDDDEETLGDGALNTSIRTQCADFSPNFMSDFRCVPVAILSSGRVFWSLSVGGNHVCAIERGTNAAYCWGNNSAGQLGPGISGAYVAAPTSPVTSNGRTLAFTSISAGEMHTCGRTTSDVVFCWGDNSNKRLGKWTSSSGVFRYGAVAAGNRHTCALDRMGWVECTGDEIMTPSLNLATLGRGPDAMHACGTNANRDVLCWGQNGEAQLGRPIDLSTLGVPQDARGVMMNGAALKADQVAVGMLSTCALDRGTVFCWGSNWHGERGNGALDQPILNNGNPTPNQVPSPAGQSFVKIAAGDRHVCGIVTSGSIYCWGANERGQLGIGQTRVLLNGVFINAVPRPTKVVGT